MIFNLYVSDLKNVIPASTKCSQYADDTTLYHHTPVQDLASGVSLINNALSVLHSWSKESNLALNPDKTKSIYDVLNKANVHSPQSVVISTTVVCWRKGP